MRKIHENKITFTTTKKGNDSEIWIAVSGWKGKLDEESVSYVAPFPVRRYVVHCAKCPMGIGAGPLYDGFTLQEVEQGVFQFELESRRRAAEEAERAAAAEAAEAEGYRIRQEEYDAGEKAGVEWMEDCILWKLGHSLEELEEHLPEIRRIFGDPEPYPVRCLQGRGESR